MVGRSMHESKACGMLSSSTTSDINVRLAEMEAKHSGSAILEARRKPMPLTLMGWVA